MPLYHWTVSLEAGVESYSLFVGQNYFFETGVASGHVSDYFYPNGDPLWDGQGCDPTSSCCTFNSPLWLNVRLSSPATNNMRSESVVVKESEMKILQYNSCNSM